jgi:ABC-type Fe3+-hydroxamate transport system substrate-binding protein
MRRSPFIHSACLLAVLCALLLAGKAAKARDFTDSLGRHVDLPDRVDHILPAGPPAEVALYTLAPGKLIGWVKAIPASDQAFLAAPYRDLPVVGRLTGHAAEGNAEKIKALKPDIIVDIGSLSPEYAKLADKIQSETGIPYVVLDGGLDRSAAMYRLLGEATGDTQPAAELGTAAQKILDRAKAADPDLAAIIQPDAAKDMYLPVADADKARSGPWPWLGNPPGVNRLIGLEWLATRDHPGRAHPGATGIDLAADTRDFYRLFYHIDLTDPQLRQLVPN